MRNRLEQVEDNIWLEILCNLCHLINTKVSPKCWPQKHWQRFQGRSLSISTKWDITLNIANNLCIYDIIYTTS